MNEIEDKERASKERLVQAYDRMLQYTEQTLNSVVSHSESALAHALENAKDSAIKLGELTREEAENVHHFVSRDLYAVGRHLAEEEREVADWLRLGLLVVEKGVLNRFSNLAQTAKLELKHLEKAKRRYDEWHTGELTTIGTLCCKDCGELIHFQHTGHIPPCPKCHATVFKRAKD
ncbi:MAG: zinc ribbon-containing protein [Arenicellales bacterium]|nr:zinc ribbon-containing protein [Arenicellales bacterium]